MQTLEEKLRTLADAVRDNADIQVRHLMFQAKAKDAVHSDTVCDALVDDAMEISIANTRESVTGVEHRHTFQSAEIDAMLAGLRLLQRTRDLPPDIREIYLDRTEGLTPEQIDTLCVLLNVL